MMRKGNGEGEKKRGKNREDVAVTKVIVKNVSGRTSGEERNGVKSHGAWAGIHKGFLDESKRGDRVTIQMGK